MTETVKLHDAEAVIEVLEHATRVMREAAVRRGCAVRLPARGRLLATGDLHDNPQHLQRIIELARLDDSAEHHVVLHELIHGEHLINSMDFSYRMLARVAELVVAYPAQVHPMLANHELSQMTGKGVSKGAGNSVELFNDALEYVFGDAWEEVSDAVKGFIRAMPLAIMSDGGVLCAHSLPSQRSMATFDLDILDRELTDDDYAAPAGSAYAMVWGRKYVPEQVAALAAHWNISLFCLGHQHVETGIETVMDGVVVLNSDHKHAKVLAIDLAEVLGADEAPMFATPL